VPIYGYRCDACSAEVEKRQSFSDAPLTTCESCGGALRRMLHPVGIVFKGSGFYNTDNRKAAAAAGANGDGANGSTENGDSGGKSSSENATSTDSGSGEGSKPAPAKSEPSTSATAAPAKT
jgi:putative FmdB family regulatory protein